MLLLVQRRMFRPRGDRASSTRIPWGVAAVVCTCTYVCIVIWYVSVPTYFDHIESSVAAISWYTSTGHSFYSRPADLAQYALPYGPALYILNAVPLRLFGPGIVASKLTGAIAALTSTAAVGWSVRRTRPILLTGATACLWYLAFGSMSFWTRAEPLLLASVAVSLILAGQRASIAVIGIGIALGLAVSVKITGGLYFLPILALLWQRLGTRPLLAALGIAVVSAAAPFILIPGVSGGGYFQVLASTARHGVRWRGVATEIQWALILVLPIFVGRWQVPPGPVTREIWELRAARIAFAIGVVVMIPVASKYGAGPYHFLPFVPAAVYLAAQRADEATPAARPLDPLRTALPLALAVIAASQQLYWIAAVNGRPSAGVAAEVRSLTSSTSGPVAVGYARDYQASAFRPMPVYAGYPYVLDAPSLMDRQIAGLPFPEGSVRMLESCAIATWLVPAGEEPFVVYNAYNPALLVFPPEFIETFHRKYARLERHRYFDVWTCHAGN